MIFSSTFFLCVFLPVTLLLYYVLPFKFKNALLLLASLIFYAWGEPVYVLLMIFSILFNYMAGIQLGDLARSKRTRRTRRHVFVFTVAVNIAILCFFKYYGFFLTNLNALLGTHIPIRDLALPIGISFYTFQILSYVIDVYWGNVKVQYNLIDFGAYITMFPQLIAGPIVRYEDIQRQLKHRKITLQKAADGAVWFIRGLSKKVLLANNIGMLFDAVYAIPAAGRPALTSWLGIIAYTFQIYFDFSGYSDMAIGLGKMMGFQFVKNFDYPYVSTSVTEFWRRWHISLGTWFREYVYIPLGGNRVPPLKHIRNMMVVWALTGFWHGADWCFLFWGLYYGILLILEKYLWGRGLAKLPAVFRHLYTMFLFVIGWLIFTAPSPSALLDNFRSLFGGLGNGFADPGTGYYLTSYLILLIICVLCSTRIVKRIFGWISMKGRIGGQIFAIAVYTLLFVTSLAYLVNATYNPFLYFKF
ncbi:MAG: MBOAT family protein [Parasporobacterium sp.]|nr:MBOAT family protein [Parasporobacterium sp.]